MTQIAAVVSMTGRPGEKETLGSLAETGLVGEMAMAVECGRDAPASACKRIEIPSWWSGSAILEALRWFDGSGASHLLWVLPGAPIFCLDGLRRLLSAAVDARADLAYGDYFEVRGDGTLSLHPLTDYQTGSIRDDFDFGPLILLSREALIGITRAIANDCPTWRFAGLYDLRLRISERGRVLHLPETVCRLPIGAVRTSGQRMFDYVDPRNRDYQIEMEAAATAHLKRIGAWLPAPEGMPVDDGATYPVRASVIIPVKNRVRTVSDAVRSALSQETSFDFNVIVVDNHSTDGTTELLAEMAADNSRLVHLIPARGDLLIGGCWNEAIRSPHCGRIAVQLDSDDLYAGTDVLERVAAAFSDAPRAVVIGSYRTVNFDLAPIPPGLVDHREWTDANGHNNALRIAGLGAPRAYHVPTLRTMEFPNVSYGEDYAVVLRLCRSYRVGRIYDPIYLCRRWEDNTDSDLPLETANRHAIYKDRLRTIEIEARRAMKQ